MQTKSATTARLIFKNKSIISAPFKSAFNAKCHASHQCRYFAGYSDIKLPSFPIYKIVLTGGPCGGKSQALPYLRKGMKKLREVICNTYLINFFCVPPLLVAEDAGFKAFTVPEAATIIFSNGAEWDTLTDAARFNSVSVTMKTQIALENSFESIAKHHMRPAVIFCDRGVLDNEAYVPQQAFWSMIMHDNEWNLPLLRERRYDLVVHMTSTAIGAEHAYSRSNNAARRETVQQAAELDKRILNGYIGHPHVNIMDNGTDFETKIKRAGNVVLDYLSQQQRRIITNNSGNAIIKKRYLIQYKDTDSHAQQKQKMKQALYPSHNDSFYAFTVC